MNPFLNTAIKAARLAGRVITYNAEKLDRLNITVKGHADFVSEVDHQAEMDIINTIKEAYPEHAIYAEESGRTAGNDFEWIIDPLDGTTNFLHGIPQYGVSIAMREKGVLKVAVIYDPVRDELFTAVKGEGALLNDRRIRVSKTDNMGYALLATGFPYKDMKNLDLWSDCFRAVLPETSGVRRAGSAALDLAWVAAGRYDGFWEFDLNAWDIAAGVLLVQEAGGMVSEVDGGRDHMLSGDIMVANSTIYRKMLRKFSPIVQKYK